MGKCAISTDFGAIMWELVQLSLMFFFFFFGAIQ